MIRNYTTNNTFSILNLAASGGGGVTSVNGMTGDVTVDLESVVTKGNTSDNDLKITNAAKGIVLKDGATYKRVILSDDGFGNYQLELEDE